MGTTRPIRLLVVCSANTCRSPMAAASIAAELAANGVAAVVASAGIEGPIGHPASAGTIEVMREVGVDLTGHRSRLIDGAEIDGSDLVLAMTSAHQRVVAARSDKGADHVFVLGEFVRLVSVTPPVGGAGGSGLDRLLRAIVSRHSLSSGGSQTPVAADEIDDPHGGSTDRYRLTRDRLAAEAVTIAAAIAAHSPT